MASGDEPLASWEHWKSGNKNLSPPPVKLWLEFTGAEEEELPAAVDKRESEVYTVTEDRLTGKSHLDNLNKMLVKSYNNIAAARRDIIRRLYHIGMSECKGSPKAIRKDVTCVSQAAVQAKSSCKALRRMGGRPVPYPEIFDQAIRAPKF